MIPGPTEMAPQVREAMGRQAVAHYGPEWLREHEEALDLLAQVFQTASPPMLLVGPGTGGLEAGAGTLLRPGERVVVAVNGSFGERLVGVMESLALEPVRVGAPWGRPIKREVLAEVLDREDNVRLLAVVHGETSTGVLNPVRELAREAHSRGALVLVDAISSLGGAWLPVDEWEIDICVGATQKCLAAPPGLTPVSVNDRAWREMRAAREQNPRGWTLNLLKWRDYVDESAVWEPYPVTVPCALVLALKESLKLLLAEGLKARCERMSRLAAAFRAGIRALGCETLAEERWCSPTTSAILLPEGISGIEARRYLDEEKGLAVGFGAGEFRERGLRIGHFGEAGNWECTARLLRALADFLRTQGREAEADAAIAAATGKLDPAD